MAITAASVDATGYYLFITHTQPASTGAGAFYPFSDYALQAQSGAPRVKVNVARAGFIRSGGQAVAATRAKVFFGLNVCRSPIDYDPQNSVAGSHLNNPTYDPFYVPNNIALAETDNGTTRTVKIILTQRVHAGEVVTLTVLAGWRLNEAAASGIPVDTSAVTSVHQKVISRPGVAPLQVVSNADFWFDPIIAAHYPEGSEAICAVEYWLTDGTNSTTHKWVTSRSTSPLYGDNLRTYGTNLNATGLYPGGSGATAGGPISVNYNIYPWTGAMRPFVSATPNLGDAFSYVCERGVPMLYDPTGTRYPAAYIVLDPINGTGSYSTVPIKSTLAAAQQVPAASKCKDIASAFTCLRVAARTTGPNTNSYDGCFIVVPDSTAIPFDNTGPVGTTPNGPVSVGTNAAGTLATNNETWVHIVGDPTLTPAQARIRCQINAQGVGVNFRASRYHWANLTINGSTHEIISGIQWIDNVSVNGSLAASSVSVLKTGTGQGFITNCSNIGQGAGFVSSFSAMLQRNYQSDRAGQATCLVGYTAVPGGETISRVNNVGDGSPDSAADNIRMNIDARGGNVAGAAPYALPINFNSTLGINTLVRCANVNVIVESIQGNYTLVSSSDGTRVDTFDNIFEGMSLVGDRMIIAYDEPPIATANITASFSGTTLTVTAISAMGASSTGYIQVGSTISGSGFTQCVVTAFGTGIGGNGTYTVSVSQTVTSRAMTSVSLNDIATLTNLYQGNVWRNCYIDRSYTKTDVFAAGSVVSARTAYGAVGTSGYVKTRTGAHPYVFGADQFNIVDGVRFGPAASAGGTQESRGLNFKINPHFYDGNYAAIYAYPMFTDDRSHFGTNAGYGDYKPLQGSPLLSMATDTNMDQDIRGVARAALFSTGAVEGPSLISAAVAFNFRRSGFVGGGVQVGL